MALALAPGALVAAALAWWVVGLPPFSGEATAAVVLAGVAAAAAGTRLPRRPPDRGGRVGRSALVWAVLAAAAAAWQLAAWLQHPRSAHPTLSSLTNALLDSQPARAAAFVLWLGAMVALARP